MTGIVVHGEKLNRGLEPVPIPRLSRALGTKTAEIADLVQALQNRPSPGSLPLPRSGEKVLQERIFDALADVKILTSQVAMHLDDQWRRKLFGQLDALHDAEEWEAGDRPVQQASFASFLRAMLNINPPRRPGLGLSNAGNLIAAWTTDKDRLTIEFLPRDRVRWVLSQQVNGETERFAGDTGIDRLAKSLAPYKPEHWFTYCRQES